MGGTVRSLEGLKSCGEKLGSVLLFSQSVTPESWPKKDLRDVLWLPGILGLGTPSLSFTA